MTDHLGPSVLTNQLFPLCALKTEKRSISPSHFQSGHFHRSYHICGCGCARKKSQHSLVEKFPEELPQTKCLTQRAKVSSSAWLQSTQQQKKVIRKRARNWTGLSFVMHDSRGLTSLALWRRTLSESRFVLTLYRILNNVYPYAVSLSKVERKI